MSRTAVRKKLLSGLTQRMSSSTAPGTSSGSAAMSSHWSEWAHSSARPRPMTVRVVSAPPEMTSPVSWTIRLSSIGQPPSSAWAHTDRRSSAGSSRRALRMGPSAWLNSVMAPMNPVSRSGLSRAPSYRMSRSDQLLMSGQRSSGKPSREAVSRAGSGAASWLTTSSSPSSTQPSINSSTIFSRRGS